MKLEYVSRPTTWVPLRNTKRRSARETWIARVIKIERRSKERHHRGEFLPQDLSDAKITRGDGRSGSARDIAMQIREYQTRERLGAVNYRNNPAVNSHPRFITALDPLKLNS